MYHGSIDEHEAWFDEMQLIQDKSKISIGGNLLIPVTKQLA